MPAVPTLETQGVKFYIGTNASPIAYTQVTGVLSIGALRTARTVRDITTLEETSIRQFKKNLREGQNLNVQVLMNLDDTGQDAMRSAEASEVSFPFKVEFTDSPATEGTFDGLVLSKGPDDIGIDGDVMETYELKPTSVLTLA